MTSPSYASRTKGASSSPSSPASFTVPSSSTTLGVQPADPAQVGNSHSALPESAVSFRSPPTNVWNKRREQMAQQSRAQPKPLQPIPQNAASDKILSFTSPHPVNGSPSSDYPSAPLPNASLNPSPDGGRRAPPPVEDAESWPEVGKGSPAKPARIAAVDEREREEQDGKSDGTTSSAHSASGVNKKSERTKWVPLPPEEWQALNPPRQRSQPQSRNGSQHPSHRHPPRASGSGDTSASISQAPSKTPSGRASKASSVHSSPRRTTRGRPLPGAYDTSGGEPSDITLRATGRGSPRIFVETPLAAPVPHASIDPNVYRNDVSHPPPLPFFLQPPPPLHHIQSSPTQPYSPSSAIPYQQHQHFPNGFMPPPQFYPHHPGTPPYPVYPPYHYPYPAPYGVYWNNAPPDPALAQSQYAQYPPPLQVAPVQPSLVPEPAETSGAPSDTEASLPAPTMIARPPPPAEIDAVAGYREVDSSALNGSSQMIFGSVGTAKEMRSPSPAPTHLEDHGAARVKRFTIGVMPDDESLHSRKQSRHYTRSGDVIDLTDPDVKLSFGTFGTITQLEGQSLESPVDAPSLSSPPRANSLQLQTSIASDDNVPPGPASSSTADTTWEVRDYGYGFGRPGVSRPSELKPGDAYNTRRRGPYYPERGGYSQDRGTRRGRGSYGRGGGGYSGGRGYARGGGTRGPPPFTVTPPSQPFQPLPPPPTPPPPPVGLFIPPHAQPYYDPYAFAPPPPLQPIPPPAPVLGAATRLPQPRSQLAFQLDPTRYHLLGQLEYYLSPQNLAQDLFLRTKMDVKGWIPIALLASFKRVQALTQHEALVHEVLALSRVVEVRAGYVRAGDGEWQRFVLPNAPSSLVESSVGEPRVDGALAVEPVHIAEASFEHTGEEVGEEEEVEFVIGRA